MEMNTLLEELINLSSREKEGEINSCRGYWEVEQTMMSFFFRLSLLIKLH